MRLAGRSDDDPAGCVADPILQLRSFPQRPGFATTPARGANSRDLQVEALRHLQDRHLRDILVRLIAEHFRQKKNIVEDPTSRTFLPRSGHPTLLRKIKRRSIGFPMSAFAQRKRRCPRWFYEQSLCHNRPREIVAISALPIKAAPLLHMWKSGSA